MMIMGRTADGRLSTRLGAPSAETEPEGGDSGYNDDDDDDEDSKDDNDERNLTSTAVASPVPGQRLLEDYDRDGGVNVGPSPSALRITTPGAHKSLTYLNGLSLVIGMQVGSGIFSAPAVVSSHVSTPLAGILVWTLAGLLIWTGASCFIELGVTVPSNGGMQEYLRMGHGDFAAFLFSCVWLAIVRPATIAMVALVFAEHINGIFLPTLGLTGGWLADKIMALVAVFGTTALNCWGIKTGAKAAGWFLVLKIAILLTIFGEYATAAFAALWVMGGWDAIGFVVGEMKDPVRDLPRILHSAMSIVVIGFTFTVTALYVVLPISVVRERDTPVVAFGNVLYGYTGFVVYTLAISLSALGSINSNVFAVGRLVVAASQRGYLPHYFAADCNKSIETAEEEGRLQVIVRKCWPRRLRLEKGVPVYAMLLTAILTSIYILMGTFRSLVVFIGITEYIIYIFTVLALFRIRKRSSSTSTAPSVSLSETLSCRLYRTNIANPIIFCLVSTLLVGRALVDEPIECGAIILVLVTIWVIWLWKSRRS